MPGDTFANWKAEMEKPGTWADNIAVVGAARALNCNILVFTADMQGSKSDACPSVLLDVGGDGPPIGVVHYPEKHYEAVVSVLTSDKP